LIGTPKPSLRVPIFKEKPLFYLVGENCIYLDKIFTGNSARIAKYKRSVVNLAQWSPYTIQFGEIASQYSNLVNVLDEGNRLGAIIDFLDLRRGEMPPHSVIASVVGVI
jgi:hypothetical protein